MQLMPTLIKRRSGVYAAQFYDRHKDPACKRLSLKTKRRRAAERALHRLEEAWDGGTGRWCPWKDGRRHEVFGWIPKPAEDLSLLGDAKRAYLQAKAHLAPATLRKYRDVLRPFTLHVGPDVRVAELTARDVLSWLDSTSANDQTRKIYTEHLGYLFRWLVQKGFMEEDISKEVPLRKVPESSPKALTGEHVRRFAQAIREHMAAHKDNPCAGDYRYLAQIMEANVCLGLRRGELIHLRWKHINLRTQTLRVANTEEFTTKSSKERTVPIAGAALRVLKRLPHRKGYVFQRKGKKINPNTLSAAWLRFRRKAGLPEWATPHATRHTCLTRLAECGVPVMVIKEVAGHQGVKTTQRYMHVRPETTHQYVQDAFPDS